MPARGGYSNLFEAIFLLPILCLTAGRSMWKFLVKLKVRDFQVPLQFLRNFRSRIAYNRWWEGGTLLQQTRGEWFNGFSSLIVLAPVQIPKIEWQIEWCYLLVGFGHLKNRNHTDWLALFGNGRRCMAGLVAARWLSGHCSFRCGARLSAIQLQTCRRKLRNFNIF